MIHQLLHCPLPRANKITKLITPPVSYQYRIETIYHQQSKQQNRNLKNKVNLNNLRYKKLNNDSIEEIVQAFQYNELEKLKYMELYLDDILNKNSRNFFNQTNFQNNKQFLIDIFEKYQDKLPLYENTSVLKHIINLSQKLNFNQKKTIELLTSQLKAAKDNKKILSLFAINNIILALKSLDAKYLKSESKNILTTLSLLQDKIHPFIQKHKKQQLQDLSYQQLQNLLKIYFCYNHIFTIIHQQQQICKNEVKQSKGFLIDLIQVIVSQDLQTLDENDLTSFVYMLVLKNFHLIQEQEAIKLVEQYDKKLEGYLKIQFNQQQQFKSSDLLSKRIPYILLVLSKTGHLSKSKRIYLSQFLIPVLQQQLHSYGINDFCTLIYSLSKFKEIYKHHILKTIIIYFLGNKKVFDGFNYTLEDGESNSDSSSVEYVIGSKIQQMKNIDISSLLIAMRGFSKINKQDNQQEIQQIIEKQLLQQFIRMNSSKMTEKLDPPEYLRYTKEVVQILYELVFKAKLIQSAEFDLNFKNWLLNLDLKSIHMHDLIDVGKIILKFTRLTDSYFRFWTHYISIVDYQIKNDALKQNSIQSVRYKQLFTHLKDFYKKCQNSPQDLSGQSKQQQIQQTISILMLNIDKILTDLEEIKGI